MIARIREGRTRNGIAEFTTIPYWSSREEIHVKHVEVLVDERS